MADTETTVETPEGEAPTTPETPVDPREALAKRHEDKRNSDIAERDPESADEPIDAGSEPAGEDTGDADEPAAAAAGDEPADEPKITLKINGTEGEYTLDEVTAMAQKGQAADQKFQQASAMMTEARRLKEQPAAAPAPAPAPESQPTGAAPAAGTGDPLTTSTPPDEELKTIISDIQIGNADEGAAALNRLLEMARGEGQPASAPEQNTNAREIAEQVTDRVTYQTALETVGPEYPAVFEDTTITKATVDLLQNFQRHRLHDNAGFSAKEVSEMDGPTLNTKYLRAARQGLVENMKDAMRGACEVAVKKFRLDVTPGSQPNVESAIDANKNARVIRKRSAANPPTSKSGRPAAPATAQRMTRRAAIADIAKARGQQV